MTDSNEMNGYPKKIGMWLARIIKMDSKNKDLTKGNLAFSVKLICTPKR